MNRSKLLPTVVIRWVSETVLQESAEEADTSADMLLLFFMAGATVMGIFVGALVGLHLARNHSPKAPLLIVLSASVAGAVGRLFLSLLLFRFRELLGWEKQ